MSYKKGNGLIERNRNDYYSPLKCALSGLMF